MTLAYVLAILLTTHLILVVASPGNRESLIMRSRSGQWYYAEALEEMAEAGVEAECLDAYYESMPSAKSLISFSYLSGPFVVVLVGGGLVWWHPGWALVVALLPAGYFALSPGFERFYLEISGRVAGRGEATRAEAIVTWTTRGASLSLAWLAMSLIYTNGGLLWNALGSATPWIAGRIMSAICAAAGLSLLGASYQVRRLGERLARKHGDDADFNLNAGSQTILYLRSFADDDLTIQTPVADCGLRSWLWPQFGFEEFISYCVQHGGKMVTVGRPREGLPRPGAYRSYFDDATWREGIRLTAMRAGVVLLTAGATDALSWEISHLKEWGVLSKCIFIIPPLPEARVARRLERLTNALDLPQAEFDKLNQIPWRCVVGLRIDDTDVAHWIVAPGREWRAYFLLALLHNSKISRVREASPGADDPSAPIEQPKVTLADMLKGGRPRRQPPGVRRMLVASMRAWQQLGNDDHAAAVDSFTRLISRELDGASDPEALAFLHSGLIESAQGAQNGTVESGALETLEQLARGLEWVWIDPTEANKGTDVRFRTLWNISRLRQQSGDHIGARQALELRLDVARELHDRRRQCDAACDLASLLLDNEDEGAESLAAQALADAEALSDVAEQGRAEFLMARARAGAEPLAAADLARTAVRHFEASGEMAQAATALAWAADQQVGRGDLDGAADLVRHALEVSPVDEAGLIDHLRGLTELIGDLTAVEGCFSDAAREVLRAARWLAASFGEHAVGTGHLLLSIIDGGDEAVLEPITQRHGAPSDVRRCLLAVLPPTGLPPTGVATGAYSGSARSSVAASVKGAKSRGSTRVDVADLLREVLNSSGYARAALDEAASGAHPSRWEQPQRESHRFSFARYSQPAWEVLSSAWDIPHARNAGGMVPQDIVAGFLAHEDCPASQALLVSGIDPTVLHGPAVDLDQSSVQEQSFSEELKRVFDYAERESLAFCRDLIETPHLLLGMVDWYEDCVGPLGAAFDPLTLRASLRALLADPKRAPEGPRQDV
ncbi:MAG: hypothetical protein LBK95_19940 [Bifidobacteriaceae bacterium]|jgi:hypothetical protein|nr:hypothetical protein [Bifidobacteriaceae bacterium]